MSIRRILLLFALCTVLYLPASFLRDLYQPDEIRNVYISKNINSLSSFLVPKYSGENYYQKPPFYFWFIKPFAGRGLKALPLLVSVNLFFVFLIILVNVKAFGKSRQAGFYSALILSSSAVFYVMAGVVRMDMMFLAFVFLSLYFFFLSVERGKLFYSLLSGVFSFLACFTKGGLGFFLPFLTGLSYIFTVRPKEGLKYFFFSAAASLILLGAWFFVYYFFVDSNYLSAMLWEQTFRRGFKPFTHQKNFWFYLPAFFCAFLPWQFLPWLWGYLKLRKKIPAGRWDMFCFIWLAGGFILLSLIKSKMIMYLLLLSIPAANLSAQALVLAREQAARLIKITLAGLAIIFTVGVLFLYSEIPVPLAAVSTAAVFLLGAFSAKSKTGIKVFYILFLCWLFVLQTGSFVYQPYISYRKGYKQIRDIIDNKGLPVKAVYVGDKKDLPVSLYFPDVPVKVIKQWPEDSFGSIFISRYNINSKTFLCRVGKYNIYYNNAAGNYN